MKEFLDFSAAIGAILYGVLLAILLNHKIADKKLRITALSALSLLAVASIFCGFWSLLSELQLTSQDAELIDWMTAVLLSVSSCLIWGIAGYSCANIRNIYRELTSDATTTGCWTPVCGIICYTLACIAFIVAIIWSYSIDLGLMIATTFCAIFAFLLFIILAACLYAVAGIIMGIVRLIRKISTRNKT